MSDFADKRHEPTPRRRQQAREQGQVAKSQDLSSAALLLAALLVLSYLGQPLAEFLATLFREHLASAWLTVDSQATSHQLLQIGAGLALYLLPILGLILLAAILAHLAQVGLLYLPQRLSPDAARISPLANFGRIFSLASGVHLGFGLAKVAAIVAVAAYCMWGERSRLMGLAEKPAAEIAAYVFHIMLWTGIKIASALLVLSLLDYGYQFWKHERDLKMTTQELREELKQQQGDPLVAARRKQVQRQLANGRLASAVPRADVIVTEPAEVAIALAYDDAKMDAPIVLAKGAGLLAQRICRLALDHSVPVVERPVLARALHKSVDVNRPVPAEQYAAVAEMIKYVYELNGKKLTAAA